MTYGTRDIPEEILQEASQQIAPVGRRLGLVVGIDEYGDRSIPGLTAAAADAKAMWELMVDPFCGYFEKEFTTILLNGDATERNIKLAVGTLVEESTNEDEVWMFFAGHAVVRDSMHFLLPVDARRDRLKLTSIDSAILKDIRANRRIVFLDCCHSGAADLSTRDVYDPKEVLQRYDGEGVVTFCSSDTSEQSVEMPDEKRGLFTYWLERGLRGEADRDHDGVVTNGELWEFVRDHVAAGAGKLNRRQTPRYMANCTGAFALSLNTEALMRKAEQKRLEQEQLTLLKELCGAQPEELGAYYTGAKRYLMSTDPALAALRSDIEHELGVYARVPRGTGAREARNIARIVRLAPPEPLTTERPASRDEHRQQPAAPVIFPWEPPQEPPVEKAAAFIMPSGPLFGSVAVAQQKEEVSQVPGTPPESGKALAAAALLGAFAISFNYGVWPLAAGDPTDLRVWVILVMALMQPPGGWLADLLKPNRALLAALVLIVAGNFGQYNAPFSTSLWPEVTALGTGICLAASVRYIFNGYSGRQRHVLLGLFGSVLLAGYVAVPLLLRVQDSFELVLSVRVLPVVVCLPVALVLARGFQDRQLPVPDAHFRRPGLILLCLLQFVSVTLFIAVKTLYPALRVHAWTLNATTAIGAAAVLLALTGRALGGWWLATLGTRRLLLLSLLLNLCALAVLTFVARPDSPLVGAAAILVLGFGCGLPFAAILESVGDARPLNSGVAVGLLSMAGGTAYVLGVSWTDLSGWKPAPEGVVAAGLVCTIVAMVIVTFWLPQERQEE